VEKQRVENRVCMDNLFFKARVWRALSIDPFSGKVNVQDLKLQKQPVCLILVCKCG
jgi:hypothetical protein